MGYSKALLNTFSERTRLTLRLEQAILENFHIETLRNYEELNQLQYKGHHFVVFGSHAALGSSKKL